MIGYFGKLPGYGDFISHNGSIEELREFDDWLQNALVSLAERENWRDHFDRLPLSFFCYQARSGNWLLGGLSSSQDASGRRYPFIIFQLLKTAQNRPFVYPHTLCELFSRQIRPLLNRLPDKTNSASLQQQVQQLRCWSEKDLELHRRIHDKFLNDFTLHDIAASLQHSYSGLMINDILQRLYDLCNRTSANNPPSISMPLPAERGLKRPVADFWLTWLAQLSPGNTLPEVSFLRDDFMQPTLFCFPTRYTDCLYHALIERQSDKHCYALHSTNTSASPHALPIIDHRSSLHEAMGLFAREVDASI